jgi:hypothetical protein
MRLADVPVPGATVLPRRECEEPTVCLIARSRELRIAASRNRRLIQADAGRSPLRDASILGVVSDSRGEQLAD